MNDMIPLTEADRVYSRLIWLADSTRSVLIDFGHTYNTDSIDKHKLMQLYQDACDILGEAIA